MRKNNEHREGELWRLQQAIQQCLYVCLRGVALAGHMPRRFAWIIMSITEVEDHLHLVGVVARPRWM